ncbi:MAG: hypothetical protein IID28_01655 [Planctomycetes bacterium]|nr:hypothetical protein [Planctomycetota bacterium]
MSSFCRFPFQRSVPSLVAVTVVVAAVSLVSPVMAGPPGAVRPGPSALPVLLASPDAERAGSDAVLRSRVAAIDGDGLAAMAAGRRLELNLFEDVSFVASVKPTAKSDAWTGSVVGDAHGFITIVKRGGLVAASIRVPGVGTYRIRPIENGRHVVEEIDEAAELPCGFAARHAVLAAEDHDQLDEEPPAVAAGAAGPVVIDVMVVYTPNTRAAAGGTAAILTLIDLFMADSNSAYQNSLVDMQINLVYAGETDYDDTGGQNHLTMLTNSGSGALDEVHGLRYTHLADMVVLLVDTAPYCGVAWLMPSNSVSSENLAFSVTKWDCSGMVFAHELGHNMGCCHAPGDGGGCFNGGLFSYSIGYRFFGQSGQQWRTVMAYAPGVLIPNFSNPDVMFDNSAVGIPAEQPGSTLNALTINQTSPTIAQFRTHLPYCETDKYVPASADANDSFGLSSARDGNVLIVGAPVDDENGYASGSAYVYEFDPVGLVWTEQQNLLAGNLQPLDLFGWRVALDGDIAVISAPGDNENGEGSGAAYVWRYDTNTSQWLEEAKLTASDGALSDRFGSSVAVSGDVIVVGAWFDDDSGDQSGSAYIFRYDAGSDQWLEQTKVLASNGQAGDRFGSSAVARGDTVIVGAQSESPGGQAGAAYVYRFDGVSWNADGAIAAFPAAAGDLFGTSMSIDGDTLIVGAEAGTGAAFVFREIGSTWVQEAKLVASDGANQDDFGASVDISGDMAIVGAPFHDDYGSGSGSAYVYRYDGFNWTQASKLLAPIGAPFDFVGDSVSIEGNMALVGASGDGEFGSNSGALHSFTGFDGTDCNGNGTPDDCEILSGDVNDLNGNGIPDTCDVPGDLDGDGTVGITDFLLLLGAWGPCGECGACLADIDGDCQVGINDMLILLGAWG